MNDWSLELQRLLAIQNEHANLVAELVTQQRWEEAEKRANRWAAIQRKVDEHLAKGRKGGGK